MERAEGQQARHYDEQHRQDSRPGFHRVCCAYRGQRTSLNVLPWEPFTWCFETGSPTGWTLWTQLDLLSSGPQDHCLLLPSAGLTGGHHTWHFLPGCWECFQGTDGAISSATHFKRWTSLSHGWLSSLTAQSDMGEEMNHSFIHFTFHLCVWKPFLLHTMWDSGTKLRWPGLATSGFTHGAISLAVTHFSLSLAASPPGGHQCIDLSLPAVYPSPRPGRHSVTLVE